MAEIAPDKVDNIIIVLGNRHGDDGHLSMAAILRGKKAVMLYNELTEKGESTRFLFTGGMNELTNSHDKPLGAHMRDYVAKHGVPEHDLIKVYSESYHTFDDAEYALPIVQAYAQKDTKIHIVTSETHIARAKISFAKVFGDEYQIFTCEAKTLFDPEKLAAERAAELAKIRKYFPEDAAGNGFTKYLTQQEIAISLGGNLR